MKHLEASLVYHRTVRVQLWHRLALVLGCEHSSQQPLVLSTIILIDLPGIFYIFLLSGPLQHVGVLMFQYSVPNRFVFLKKPEIDWEYLFKPSTIFKKLLQIPSMSKYFTKYRGIKLIKVYDALNCCCGIINKRNWFCSGGKTRKFGNYFNKGYHLFTGNFYNSIELAKTLMEKGTFITGTIRHNKKLIPKEATITEVGEPKCFSNGDILMCFYCYKHHILISTDSYVENVTVKKKFKNNETEKNHSSYESCLRPIHWWYGWIW